MNYNITDRTYGDCPHIEAIVNDATMANPSTLPSDWPAGSIIYTTGYAIVKTKGLDGNWTEVTNGTSV